MHHSTVRGEIAGILSSQPDLSELLGLATLVPSLVALLGNANNVTILAPTNAAFAALPNNSVEGLAVQSRNATAVAALLTNHVIKGYYNSTLIPNNTPAFVQTFLNSSYLDGTQPYTNTTGGQYLGVIKNGNDVDIISGNLNVGRVVQADISGGANVVIHKIDSVNRFSPIVQQYAVGSGNTVVNQAIQYAMLASATGVNSTTPSPLNAANLTFFLPNNQAFADIASLINQASIPSLFLSILSYHIVPKAVLFSPNLTKSSVTTLQGNKLTVSVLGEDIFINSAKVILANGILFNGAAHIIDEVLNPNNSAAVTESSSNAGARVSYLNVTTASALSLSTVPVSATTTFSTPALLTTLAAVQSPSSQSGNAAAHFDTSLSTSVAFTTGTLVGAILLL